MKNVIEALNSARANVQSRILDLRAEIIVLERELAANSTDSSKDLLTIKKVRPGSLMHDLVRHLSTHPRSGSTYLAKVVGDTRQNTCSRLNRLWKAGILVREGTPCRYRWSVA